MLAKIFDTIQMTSKPSHLFLGVIFLIIDILVLLGVMHIKINVMMDKYTSYKYKKKKFSNPSGQNASLPV